jgi:hypothetical protein
LIENCRDDTVSLESAGDSDDRSSDDRGQPRSRHFPDDWCVQRVTDQLGRNDHGCQESGEEAPGPKSREIQEGPREVFQGEDQAQSRRQEDQAQVCCQEDRAEVGRPEEDSEEKDREEGGSQGEEGR